MPRLGAGSALGTDKAFSAGGTASWAAPEGSARGKPWQLPPTPFPVHGLPGSLSAKPGFGFF